MQAWRFEGGFGYDALKRVDLILPDITWLKQRADRLDAVLVDRRAIVSVDHATSVVHEDQLFRPRDFGDGQPPNRGATFCCSCWNTLH